MVSKATDCRIVDVVGSNESLMVTKSLSGQVVLCSEVITGATGRYLYFILHEVLPLSD